jgi:hypothetical protein
MSLVGVERLVVHVGELVEGEPVSVSAPDGDVIAGAVETGAGVSAGVDVGSCIYTSNLGSSIRVQSGMTGVSSFCCIGLASLDVIDSQSVP